MYILERYKAVREREGKVEEREMLIVLGAKAANGAGPKYFSVVDNRKMYFNMMVEPSVIIDSYRFCVDSLRYKIYRTGERVRNSIIPNDLITSEEELPIVKRRRKRADIQEEKPRKRVRRSR